MCAETTTISITAAIREAARHVPARPDGYRGRRRHVSTDRRVLYGLALYLAAAVPVLGLLVAWWAYLTLGVRP